MARRIVRLIEEQEDESKKQKARELVVKIARTQEGLQTLSIQKKRTPTPEVIREEILHSKPLREHQQCEATFLREYKNKNGKRNLVTKITETKARKLSKKKEKIERLQEVPKKTS